MWSSLKPALAAFNAAVIDRLPSLKGSVERHTYGEAYFSAMAYLMADPLRDEHEVALLELRVLSTVGPRDKPPSRDFNPADPATVDFEISVSGIGPIAHTERAIPAHASSDDINRIVSAFVAETLESLPAHAQHVADVLEEQMRSGPSGQ